MKEDIKEILDDLGDKDCYINNETTLRFDEAKDILDYITNLQEKVNQYENPDDMTLFYMWLNEKAKDKIKQLKEEVNKLTAESTDWESKCYKLQDTLKDREEYITHLEELSNKYEEEHSTTFEYWKHLVKEDYKSRCEKAIVILNNIYLLDNVSITNNAVEEIDRAINILQGSDKE